LRRISGGFIFFAFFGRQFNSNESLTTRKGTVGLVQFLFVKAPLAAISKVQEPHIPTVKAFVPDSRYDRKAKGVTGTLIEQMRKKTKVGSMKKAVIFCPVLCA
jgi:hypothetical protein